MSRTATIATAAAFAVAALVAAPAPADTIATTSAFLPAVNIDGATGTFITDVWIFNPEPNLENDVRLYFTPAGVDGSNLPGFRIDPPLAPRESIALKDILKNYFGKTKTFGLLEIQGEYPIMVTSNTYNVAGATPGTYGQYSPGQPKRNALGFEDSIYGNLYINGLTNDPVLRTNAVVMNPSDQWLEAGVQLLDAFGASHRDGGTRIYSVPPYSLIQLNDVFGSEFASILPPGPGPYRLNIFVNLDNGALILGYATVTDKRTGDPYLIPAEAMRP